MDMTGEYRIAAPKERVWAALNDAEVLRQAIPGCDEIEKTSDTEFTAKVTAKVGPVKAKFGGKVTLSDIDPPNGYTISGEGTGGAAGFAKGGAKVSLASDGAETVLSYTVNASVGGKLAQIGSRLIDGTARKMADEFFGKFAAIVAGAPAEGGSEASGEAAAPLVAVEQAVAAPEPLASPAVPPAEPAPALHTAARVPSPAETGPAAFAAVEGDPVIAASAADATVGLGSPTTSAAPPLPVEPGPTQRRGTGLHPAVWISALVIVVALLLWYFV